MLNITDLDNYDAIDFIRENFRKEYAAKKGHGEKISQPWCQSAQTRNKAKRR